MTSPIHWLHRSASRALLGLLAATSLAAGGCAAGDFFRPQPCFSDDECIGGQQCSFGACTWIPSFTLDLEVTPLPSSGFLFQAVDDIDPTSADPLRVRVPEPIHLSLEAPVAATARFHTGESLRRPRSFEATLEKRAGEDVARGSVDLIKGVRDGRTGAIEPLSYDVVAEPLEEGCCAGSGPCLAPAQSEGLVPTADSTFVLPLSPDPPPVIVRGRVLVSESAWTPVENLQVQLFDPSTGVRSLATHTASDGSFCLAVVAPPPGAPHQMVLRLGPSDTRPTIEIPQITIGPDDVDLGTLYTGDHGTPIRLAVNTVSAPNGDPVQGAQVLVTGSVDPRGTFSQATTTDAAGHFSLRLLPGVYRAVILAPAEGSLASAVVEGLTVPRDPSTQPDPLQIVLRPRPHLRGRVLSSDATTPVADVEVVAEPIGEAAGGSGSSASLAGLTFSTRTDASGAYDLPVDPGSYRIAFRPPIETGAPWSVGHVVSKVESDRSLAPIVLEAPVTFGGTVLGEPTKGATEPLAGAQIEVLGRTPDGERFVVGSAWSDEAGAFDTVLPQSLAEPLDPAP